MENQQIIATKTKVFYLFGPRRGKSGVVCQIPRAAFTKGTLVFHISAVRG
jgi:hypothetical protein